MIEDVFEEVLYVLAAEDLLGIRRRAHMVRLFEHTVIQIREEESYRQSACILPRPALVNGNLDFDRVILRIGYHPDPNYQLYILYHEISHLISVGEIQKIDPTTYVLPWGICKTTYSICEKGISSFVNRKNYLLNEKMNDCLACFLYSAIEKKKPSERILVKRGALASYEQMQVIRDYLNHVLDGVNDGCLLM